VSKRPMTKTRTKRCQLYHLTRLDIDRVQGGYDYFSDMVVAAHSTNEAQRVRPSVSDGHHDWPFYELVKVEWIGSAAQRIKAGTIICASYHAG
jgi:hypothetical protein